MKSRYGPTSCSNLYSPPSLRTSPHSQNSRSSQQDCGSGLCSWITQLSPAGARNLSFQPLPLQVFLCQPEREMPGAETGLTRALLDVFAGMNRDMCLALASGSLQTLPKLHLGCSGVGRHKITGTSIPRGPHSSHPCGWDLLAPGP